MSLESRLIALVRGLDGRLPDLASPIELAEHGETAVAAEIVIDNLYELDIVLTAAELVAFERLAADLHLAPMYLATLRALPRPGETRRRVRLVTVGYVATGHALHELLARALGFPDYYGHNWNAFWDSITGLVEMPETLQLRDWDVLARALPRDAFYLLDCLLMAAEEEPSCAARIELVASDGSAIDPAAERARLR